LEANAKEYYGEEAWDAMTPEQQQSKTYCIDLLCWAHLRNLFIGEGAKHERAYIKDKLQVGIAYAYYSPAALLTVELYSIL
jgi:hypothetical protein